MTTQRETLDVIARWVNHLTDTTAEAFSVDKFAPLSATEAADVERACNALGVGWDRVQAEMFRAFVTTLAIDAKESIARAGL